MSQNRNQITRRRALQNLGSLTAGGLILPAHLLAADQTCVPTPAQTSGPFYPVPEIARQEVHDTDLTRRFEKDELAKGEILTVGGQVRDRDCRPIKGAIVEIWQASTSGRYNHERDRNPAELDENFQYWGRMTTGEEGKYSFRTIKPGEYPGRTPHIHFRVIVPGQRDLITQMYFESEGRSNAKDGIYRRLSRTERNQVTVAFARADKKDDAKSGTFDVVIATQ